MDSEQSNTWIATASIGLNKRATNFKLDTGAEVTAILIEPPPPLSPATKKLCGPSRQPLKTRGYFQGIITHEKRTTEQSVYVVDGLKTDFLPQSLL